MDDVTGPVWVPTVPPSLEQFLSLNLQPIPVLPAVGLILATFYLAAAIRQWRARRRWPALRTISFLSGCALLIATTGLGLEGYGYVMFSVFMFQQLTLMIAVPPLLVLGAPGTLLLRTAPHRGPWRWIQRLALAGLRRPLGRWILHPAVTISLFLVTFYGLYLGGLADVFLRSWIGHTALEVWFLAVGVLFAVPVLGLDPLPIRQTQIRRVLDVVAEVALHAFFGVIIMVTTTPLVRVFADAAPSLGVDPLRDQQIAGGLAWSYGEGPSVLILLYLVHRWFRADTRKAALADRRADREGDHELDAYNEYLSRLRSREAGPDPRTTRDD